MDKEKLREIIYIVVAVVFAILAFKLFIWLLPLILIGLLAYFIYSSMKKNKEEPIFEKATTKSSVKKKTKKIIIIDEENND